MNDIRETTAVLLIEDDNYDAQIIEKSIRRETANLYRVVRVASLASALDFLSQPDTSYQVILLDLNLPDAVGLEGLNKIVKATGNRVPVIILSGAEEASIAEAAIKNEAEDYIQKQTMSGIAVDRSIRYSIERHRARNEVQLSHERFRQLTHIATDRFWETDEGHVFIDTDDTLLGDHAPKRAAMLGNPFWHVEGLKPAADEEWQRLKTWMNEHRPFRGIELAFESSDGHVSHWSINGAPKFDGEQFTGYLGTALDISSQKAAETMLRSLNQDLSKTKAKLERLNAQKDRFFSLIAHDLRSPFNSLMGAAAFFRDGIMGADVEQRKNLGEKLFDAAQGAYNLVEDLLQWSQLQLQQSATIKEPFDLTNILREVGDHCRAGAVAKGIELNYETTGNAPVMSDRQAITATLRNIMTNALKFTETGGTVTAAISQDDGMYVVSVRDTGVGLSDKQMENLFALGVNVSTPGTGGERGTGLGLLLCKELIEKNGGNISIESELGAGTTVRFSVPIKT